MIDNTKKLDYLYNTLKSLRNKRLKRCFSLFWKSKQNSINYQKIIVLKILKGMV
ncbi:hypothetical protein MNB_SV-12-502 [hydrothermal vent metagenome]|uniref:Uncharacterized protein n=1 Tax=hydrothermal vent metagenome TaxID=652676 RepID=A0A1W1CNG9_9ZZZZ